MAAPRRELVWAGSHALILPIAVQADAWLSSGSYRLTQLRVITLIVAFALGLGRANRPSYKSAAPGDRRAPVR